MDARCHTAAATVDLLAIISWEHLDHPPYNPDLAPSDFHFFPALKKTLGGQHFTTNADIETAVCTFVITSGPYTSPSGYEFGSEGLLIQQIILCPGFEHTSVLDACRAHSVLLRLRCLH